MIDPEDSLNTFNMKWCRGKIFEKAAVTVIHRRLQRDYDVTHAEVTSVKRQKVK